MTPNYERIINRALNALFEPRAREFLRTAEVVKPRIDSLWVLAQTVDTVEEAEYGIAIALMAWALVEVRDLGL